MTLILALLVAYLVLSRPQAPVPQTGTTTLKIPGQVTLAGPFGTRVAISGINNLLAGLNIGSSPAQTPLGPAALPPSGSPYDPTNTSVSVDPSALVDPGALLGSGTLGDGIVNPDLPNPYGDLMNTGAVV